ncbi:hypothetical protein ABW21_db0206252 [Orbilia brochopaga]|nr:hypothetical protein ABW21_db0206252 [Drechslerella brochopaga]
MPPQDAAPAASASAREDVVQSISKDSTVVCKRCQAKLVGTASIDRRIIELKLLVLSCESSAGLTVATKNRRGKEIEGEISSYRDVNCDSCKHVVGRKYATIARCPDVQDKIALLLDEIDVRSNSETIMAEKSKGDKHPKPTNMPEELTNIKRFCLMLHDGQESLRAQVAQLAQQPSENNPPVQQHPEPHSCSCSKELEELKIQMASLQGIVEKNNRLMAQMKLQSKRSYADFAVEIPVIRRRNDDSSEPALERNQPQRHPSPPPSVLSAEKGDGDDHVNGDRNDEGSLREQVTAEEQPQPREADSRPGSIELAPIVISDGEESDDNDNYQEGGKTPARRAAKRARLAKEEASRGSKKGRGRPSIQSRTDPASDDDPTFTVATPKAQLDSVDKDNSSMSTGRVTRSRK